MEIQNSMSFYCPFCEKEFFAAQSRASHITKGHAGKQRKAYMSLDVMERTAPRIPALETPTANGAGENKPTGSAASPAATNFWSPLRHVEEAIKQARRSLEISEAEVARLENLLRDRAVLADHLKILEATRDRLMSRPAEEPAESARRA